MKLDLQGVLGDAWRWWKRDRAVLTSIAGLLIFVPQLAALAFVPEQPARPENLQDMAAVNEWTQTMLHWLGVYGPVVFACDALALYGALALYACYLHPERPDVGGALRAALRVFPRFLVAAMIVQFAFGIGLSLFILPGIYVSARMSLVGPIFAAERPEGILAAIRASFVRTRGYSFALFVLAGITVLGSAIIGSLFTLLGDSLGHAPLANPVSAVLIKIAVALSLSLGALAAALIHVSVYRRIGSPEG